MQHSSCLSCRGVRYGVVVGDAAGELSLFLPKQSIGVSPVASFSCISSPKSCFPLLKGFSGLRCALIHVKPNFTRLQSPKLFSSRNGANLPVDTLPTAAAGLGSPLGKGIPTPLDLQGPVLAAEGFGLGRKVIFLPWLKKQRHFSGFWAVGFNRCLF